VVDGATDNLAGGADAMRPPPWLPPLPQFEAFFHNKNPDKEP
jgi:hypothetical protein